MEKINQTDLINHCIREIRRFPISRIGLEHFIFMKLLEELPSHKYKELVDMYEFTNKE